MVTKLCMFILRFEILIQPYEVLEKEYQILKKKLLKVDSPVVYAHNDLLLTNILYNRQQESVIFIDYEYTAFNYQAFDIANHFAEFAGNYISLHYFMLFFQLTLFLTECIIFYYIKCQM